MNALIDFYQKEAESARSSIPWVATYQEQALADFVRLGFPTRRDDAWKYTPLHAFAQQSFARRTSFVPLSHHAPITGHPLYMDGTSAVARTWPAGVMVEPIARVLAEHPLLMEPWLGTALQHEHGFLAMNSAFFSTGMFIYVPENVCLSEPLYITHAHTQEHEAAYIRHVIVLAEGASARVIVAYDGEEGDCYMTNTVTEIILAKNAHLTYYTLQNEGKKAYHFGHLAVRQAEKSEFTSHVLAYGAQLSRSDLSIHLQEPYAKCTLNGLYVTGDQQHLDQHTLVHHAAPDCQSVQDYKGILAQKSHAVFDGKVRVDQEAQRTIAKQQNKNLLLSPHAQIDTKPQLEIFADDVVCTHGATVGQLDEEALFYLATRGIDKSRAAHYLIQAFAEANIRAFEDQSLIQWVQEHVRMIHATS